MSTTYTESVSGEVRAGMARYKITQRQLAMMLGTSHSYINRRMTGAVPWSTDDLERIAYALRVPIADLTSPRALAS